VPTTNFLLVVGIIGPIGGEYKHQMTLQCLANAENAAIEWSFNGVCISFIETVFKVAF